MLQAMTADRLTAGNIRLEELGDFVACFSRDTGTTIVLDTLTATVAGIVLDSGPVFQTDIVSELEPLLEGSDIEADAVVSNAVEKLIAEKLITPQS